MVDLGFRESVFATFPIIARDDESQRYLIETTNLFIGDWAGLRDFLPFMYGVGFGLDRSRSALVSAKSFPKNVEIEVDLMFASSAPIPSLAIPDNKTLPIAIHYSLLELPEEPMKPRLADDRIGYFTTAYVDFDKQAEPSSAVHIANRWRLEKKDPYAQLSEPVKPIIFYLENTIPVELRPFIKEGVEAWNKAFEAAGFKNAILAMDQPNDPNWDPGDARYSTIRWMPAIDAGFAIGPSDVDPRSGEILNADILFTSNWTNALAGQQTTFVESPLDFLSHEAEAIDMARKLNPNFTEYLCALGVGMLPQSSLLRYTLMADGTISMNGEMPFEIVAEGIREVTMHEVGHTLGLRHNFKASSFIPYNRLHDKAFTAEQGITASVMDYNPPNVASNREEQGHYYSHVVGAYDVWAIQWGYMPVGNESLTPHPQLTAIAEEHSKWGHEYGTDEDAWIYPYAVDPTITQFDLGSDPIDYYRNQQALVSRLWSNLENRVVPEGGELWPLRGALHSLLWNNSFGYVYQLKALGGLEVTRAHSDDPAGVTPLKVIPADEQRRALDFVLEVFSPGVLANFPKELLDKAVPERNWDQFTTWTPGTRFTYPLHDIVTSLRTLVLDIAFWPERLARIRDNAYRSDESKPFTLGEFYQGFTDAIWGDVLAGRQPADSFQRAIQSAYLDRLIVQATGDHASSDLFAKPAEGNPIALHASPSGAAPGINDARALAFAELKRIHKAIGEMLDAGGMEATNEAHLLEAQYRIGKMLGI